MYVVSGMVASKGYRTNISEPMTHKDADRFKRQLTADLDKSAPRNKWVSDLWIEMYVKKDVIL